MTSKPNRFEPMTWVSAALLPETMQRYVDGDQPLREDDHFLPTESFGKLYLVLAGFWLVCFGTMFAAMLFESAKRLLGPERQPGDPGLPLVVLLALLAAALFGIHRSWRGLTERRSLRQQWKSGRFRDGIFVLSDGLLIHQRRQALFLPREAITGFQRVDRGKSETPYLYVHYDTPDGPVRTDLNRFELGATTFNLIKHMQHWLKDGSWKPLP